MQPAQQQQQQPSSAAVPTLESVLAHHPLAGKLKLRPGMLESICRQVGNFVGCSAEVLLQVVDGSTFYYFTYSASPLMVQLFTYVSAGGYWCSG